MFGIRSVFRFSKKEKKPTAPLPPDWPSSLHSKCSVPTCLFPNPPQAAEGRYNCQGGFRGFECGGTYYVSASRAHAMVKKHVFQTRRATDVKLKAQKALEAHRQQLIKAQKAMAEAKALAATTCDLEVACEPSKQSRHTKDLPPIPGLSLRRKQRPSAPRVPPSAGPCAPTSPPRHGPLHSYSVRQYPVGHHHPQRPRPANPSLLPSSASHRRAHGCPSPSRQPPNAGQNHTRQYGSSYTPTKF